MATKYCGNCGSQVDDGGRFCPSCGAAIETTAREVASVANPEGDRIQSESFSGNREGSRQAPLSETRVRGNVEGHFSGGSSKKGLILAVGGILILVALGGGGYWWWSQRTPATMTSSDDIVIEKGTVQTPEKKPEEKPAEAKTAPVPPVQDKKAVSRIVKKAPKASSPAPKASSNEPWRYRVETPASKPAPQPRAQAKETGNPLGKLFKAFEGPAPDVTPPPPVNDARGTGM